MKRLMLATLFVVASALMILALSKTPAAHAEVSVQCVAHLAERPGTTASADRRYHLEQGEFSPCSEQDAGENREGEVSRGASSSPEDNGNDRDKKSRHCRKHWYC